MKRTSAIGASCRLLKLHLYNDDWRHFDKSVNAICFRFVATAILISMFLVMAIFETFLMAVEIWRWRRGGRWPIERWRCRSGGRWPASEKIAGAGDGGRRRRTLGRKRERVVLFLCFQPPILRVLNPFPPRVSFSISPHFSTKNREIKIQRDQFLIIDNSLLPQFSDLLNKGVEVHFHFSHLNFLYQTPP